MIHVYSTHLTDRFRGLTVRDGVLLRGAAGWGEFSPFWDYDDETSVPWLRAAVEAATRPFPTPLRRHVDVNATVPAVGPERAREIAAGSGCRTVKVKVAEAGQTLADDLSRVAAVRDGLGPDGCIRIDANGAWSVDDAVDALPRLDRAAGGLQYAEQPVASVEDLARVRRRVSVPVAADESIRRATDPLAVRRADAADVVVMKVQPLGGVRACLDLADRIGLPVVVSSALESSVGIAQGIALASSLQSAQPLAAGLATVRLFVSDVTSEPLVPHRGSIAVRRVSPESVPPAPAEVDRRWRERLDRVAALAGIDLEGVLG